MTPLIIGTTSHRNIPAREIEPIRQRVREFLAQLKREFPELPLLVLSALAQGGDQLVASEALAAGARVIAPLPLPRAVYAQDFVDPAAHAAFDALCAQVQVIELPLLPGNSLDSISARGRERDRQYAQSGVFIARHCHILLAIWDGKGSNLLGGTAQIVRYYLTGTLPGTIERRRQFLRNLTGSGDERLLFHAVCSRTGSDGAPAAPLQPLQVGWRTQASAVTATAEMPRAFRTVFEHMAGFNEDRASYQTAIDAAPGNSTALCGDSTAGMGGLDGLFCAADWLAIHFQKRVLLAMRTTYILAALMGIAFMSYSDLPAQDYMIFVFLLLFAGGVAISTIASRRDWHRKYLDYRALAEGLRVQAYWRRAGISLTGDPEFGHDSFLQKQDVELGWIRNVMRGANLPEVGAVPVPQDLAGVIRDWVGDADSNGQLAYYLHKGAQRARTHRITEAIGTASLWAGIGISVVLAVFVTRLSQDAKTALVAIMAVLSILAAVREAYAYRKADKELIKQYRFMQRIFADARRALDSAAHPGEQREILRTLGETALAEHVEWALMHRQRPLEHGKF